MFSGGICCIDDEPLYQECGCICCNRRSGICPVTCCKYDADALCWGSVCCSMQIDYCGVNRLILDALCFTTTTCYGYRQKDCILYYCCCNPRKAAQDRMAKTAREKKEHQEALKAHDAPSKPAVVQAEQPVETVTPSEKSVDVPTEKHTDVPAEKHVDIAQN